MNKEENYQEEYNPEKHCCQYWYKDFCDCIKRFRVEQRDSAVESTLEFLNSNNIKFTESNISNVVNVNPETDNVFLSLKPKRGLLRVRYNGSNKWYSMGKKKFLEKFN